MIKGNYIPSPTLFGQIVSGKPWWGLRGQYCLGDGKESIAGFSEESRYLLNPYMLIGINELNAYRINDPDCYPVYLKPISLFYYPNKKEVLLTYDYSSFIKQKKDLQLEYNVEFITEDYNARDFGFNYFYAHEDQSTYIVPVPEALLFKAPVRMKNYIHLGQSCNYPGGCNNASPYDPEVIFKIQSTPAYLYLKLWYKKPHSIQDPADLIYIIKFQ